MWDSVPPLPPCFAHLRARLCLCRWDLRRRGLRCGRGAQARRGAGVAWGPCAADDTARHNVVSPAPCTNALSGPVRLPQPTIGREMLPRRAAGGTTNGRRCGRPGERQPGCCCAREGAPGSKGGGGPRGAIEWMEGSEAASTRRRAGQPKISRPRFRLGPRLSPVALPPVARTQSRGGCVNCAVSRSSEPGSPQRGSARRGGCD